MAIGYLTPLSSAALRTLSTSPSNVNSGVWTPMTTSPCSLYLAAHARMYGAVRSQLMQVYVQKSTSTTLPCRSAAVRGAELSHVVALPSEARSLAPDCRNGSTVIHRITESLVPTHAAASEKPATPTNRRRSDRCCSNTDA